MPGYPDNFCHLDSPSLPKSVTSPFVACVIAWKYYGATEIHLFGVDMINHPHIQGELIRKSKIHFKNLQKALEPKGCALVVHGDGVFKELNQSLIIA